jgi:predicted nucleic acid-binding protein
MRFVDTNVLLYSVSTAAAERQKAKIAQTILDDPDLALSVQVLQEFYVQATRESKSDSITHEQAAALVEAYLRFMVQETTVALMQAALETKQRFRISYSDAAMIEAARMLACDTVPSEDLGHGQVYERYEFGIRTPQAAQAVSPLIGNRSPS